MIIYCIQNLINHKKYVGCSIFYNSNEELQKSKYWGSGLYIRRAIKKYGIENFKRWVLVKNIFDFEKLKNYEKLWIKKLKTKSTDGYNLNDGGTGNINPSQEIRKKISSSVKNLWMNSNYRETQLKSHNKKLTELHKKHQSKGQKRRYANPEEHKRQSERQKKRWENNLVARKEASNRQIKKYQDPEERKKLGDLVRGKTKGKKRTIEQNKRNSEAQLKYWKNPQAHKKLSIALKKRFEKFEEKEKLKTAAKKRWNKIEEREKAKIRWNNPKTRKKHLDSIHKEIFCIVCGKKFIRQALNSKKCFNCKEAKK